MSAEISPGREYGLPGDSKPKGLLFAFFDVGSPYTFVQKIDGIVRLAFPNDNTAFWGNAGYGVSAGAMSFPYRLGYTGSLFLQLIYPFLRTLSTINKMTITTVVVISPAATASHIPLTSSSKGNVKKNTTGNIPRKTVSDIARRNRSILV